MAKPITDGPVQIMLKEPIRSEAVRAADSLGVSVTQLLHEVLAESIGGGSLEVAYLAALQRRVKTKSK